MAINTITAYPLKLIVKDTAGCADTASRVSKARNNCYIVLPLAFTPNGDGHNDYLYPLNAYKANNLIFKVYDRNGQLIFQTRDWTKKWDGSFQGIPQPMGTFIWTLDYMDANNNRISLKGTTVLIR